MQRADRKLAFILASTNHGAMIVNRLDYFMMGENQGIGVGLNLLERGHFDPEEVSLAVNLLNTRRRLFGDGVVAIDCGANIGVHTIEWAVAMTGWGSVLAVEAQERIFYALAGNIAINNCFNATAINAAVSSENGTLTIPKPNYLAPASFGSLELRQRSGNEFIGQPIDYTNNTTAVSKIALDVLKFARLDFLKIDVEGMEIEALEGAKETIDRTRPIMLLEKIKTNAPEMRQWLIARGYETIDVDINMLAIHKSDPTLREIQKAVQPSAA